MFRYLKQLSYQRSSWLLLLISALLLEGTALYFQYGMDLQPCVMCIYERVALFGIAFAALLGFIAPNSTIIRILALIIGLISSVKGILLAIKHVDYQINPAPWNQCSVVAEFPQTLPLDKWIPLLFNPSGSCSDVSWVFLNLSMAQWILITFIIYTVLLVLILLSQLATSQQRRRLFH